MSHELTPTQLLQFFRDEMAREREYNVKRFGGVPEQGMNTLNDANRGDKFEIVTVGAFGTQNQFGGVLQMPPSTSKQRTLYIETDGGGNALGPSGGVFPKPAQPPVALPTNPGILLQIELRWGSGGASYVRRYTVFNFAHIPIGCDACVVSIRAINRFALDEFGEETITTGLGGALPAGIIIRGKAFFSDGIEGLPTRPTYWTLPTVLAAIPDPLGGAPIGLGAIIIPRPCRVLTVECYRTTAVTTPLYLLAFDMNSFSKAGDKSIDGGPIPQAGVGALNFSYSDTDGYTNGYTVIASSTAPLLTNVNPDAGEKVIVRVEELQG